jgi:hypothetical protein
VARDFLSEAAVIALAPSVNDTKKVYIKAGSDTCVPLSALLHNYIFGLLLISASLGLCLGWYYMRRTDVLVARARGTRVGAGAHHESFLCM